MKHTAIRNAAVDLLNHHIPTTLVEKFEVNGEHGIKVPHRGYQTAVGAAVALAIIRDRLHTTYEYGVERIMEEIITETILQLPTMVVEGPDGTVVLK